MRIATWNVNSIKARMDHALAWLKEDTPDVVLLQETKCTDDSFPALEFESLGYKLALHGQKSYNGVAILSKYPISDVVRGLPHEPEDEHTRYIEGTVNDVRVASVYVPNGQSIDSDKYAFKLRFLDRLKRHVQILLNQRMPLVIGGDYNIAPEDLDVHNPKAWKDTVLCHTQARAGLRSVMNLGLYDAFRVIHPTERAYSWWDYRSAALEMDDGLRIDHLLISSQAVDRLQDCSIVKKVRMQEKASDHAPVILTLSL